jgi:hypothetical protein
LESGTDLVGGCGIDKVQAHGFKDNATGVPTPGIKAGGQDGNGLPAAPGEEAPNMDGNLLIPRGDSLDLPLIGPVPNDIHPLAYWMGGGMAGGAEGRPQIFDLGKPGRVPKMGP